MRRVITTGSTAALLTSTAASACPTCRPDVVAGILNEHFWGRLSLTVLPFLVLLLIVGALVLATREVPSAVPVKSRSDAPGPRRRR
ncbi:hypothetical protein [Myxococcus sp. Y35]|uniref:hypothetical protein n=1 Tax=Pseudomyxococcus flavus TaxID=3115648 RepID=UPI003CEA9D43